MDVHIGACELVCRVEVSTVLKGKKAKVKQWHIEDPKDIIVCHALPCHTLATPYRCTHIRWDCVRWRWLCGCSSDGECYAKCRWEGLPDAKANLSKLCAPGLWMLFHVCIYYIWVCSWRSTYADTIRLQAHALSHESTFASSQAILWAMWLWIKLIFPQKLKIIYIPYYKTV